MEKSTCLTQSLGCAQSVEKGGLGGGEGERRGGERERESERKGGREREREGDTVACLKAHQLGTAPCHHPQDRCSPGRALLLPLKLYWEQPQSGLSQSSMAHFCHQPVSGQAVEGRAESGSQ